MKPTESSTTSRSNTPEPIKPSTSPAEASWLARADAWMKEHPANPRFMPFMLWIGLSLALVQALGAVSPWLVPPVYAFSCFLVGWALWRYRKLTPELTIRFHWSVIPSGVFLLVAWIFLGWLCRGELPKRLELLQQGQLVGSLKPNAQPHQFESLWAQSPILYWLSLHLRFVGMVIIVPLFEELFSRSLCVRMLSNAKLSSIGLLQVLEDLPLVGDLFIGSRLTKKAAEHPPMFTQQFNQTPFGKVTYFAVFASTIVFMLSHMPVDWLGCIACGVIWCAMVAWTNRSSLPQEKRLGLGPVIWSHAITNALLWWYSWGTGDWQFL